VAADAFVEVQHHGDLRADFHGKLQTEAVIAGRSDISTRLLLMLEGREGVV
jgi:hypothetical protein